MRELDPLVSEYQHDKRLPREAEALTSLRKVASLVKPIMRQRSWKVGTLCEFYPQEKNLLGLNINMGQKICLRLRYASDKNRFIPIEQVVDTMLHELCHNVHGPHNQQFQALWNQLRDEHEQLIRRGYTGEGFLSNGKRLGGQTIPLDEARRRARAAAEKRQTLSAGSGRKLGGAPVLRGTNIRQVIADAAQRRITVTKGCASGTDEGKKLAEDVSHNGFKTKAEEEDANEQAIMQAYIEMIQQEEKEAYGSSYIPPSQENPAGPRSSGSPPPIPESSKPASNPPSLEKLPETSPVDLTTDDSFSPDNWSCPICTLSNPANFLCCDACAAERPKESKTLPPKPKTIPAKRPSSNPLGSSTKPSGATTIKPRNSAIRSIMALESKKPTGGPADKPLGWLCHQCGTFMETEWWTCTRCGTMKLSG